MTAPRLSAAILTRVNFASIRKTVGFIASQDIASSIELIIVVPDAARLELDSGAVSSLHSVQVVEADAGRDSGKARAAAVRAARAPVIVFTEDHCFPQPGWAAALLEAHQGPWAGVGPVVHNANPQKSISWADLLMGYGPWLAPGKSGEREHLPGHNSSYKCEALLALGDELPVLMESETPLQWRLRATGHRLYLESAAEVAHTNFDQWSTWLRVAFHSGRLFAATRALEWTRLRRAVFVLASPLIPIVRYQRHVRHGVEAGLPMTRMLRVAPTLAVGLLMDGVGQTTGMLFGAGRSTEAMAGWEFDRNMRRPRATSSVPGVPAAGA